MYRCPIDYFTDNIIFNVDKSCWAAFRLIGYDYDFLSAEGKLSILYRTTKFLSGILSDAQLLIVPVEQDMESHFEQLKQRVNEEDMLCYCAIQHAEQTEHYLKQKVAGNGASNDYSFYMLVKLEEYTESEFLRSIKDGYEYFIKNPANAIHVWMNMDTKDILTSKIEKCRKLAEKWFFEQGKRMEMEKIPVEEVQWLIRRGAFRGIKKAFPVFYQNSSGQAWKPYAEEIKMETEEIVKPWHHDVVNLFSGKLSSENRILKVEQDGETSYQSFLVITHMVDLEYPGCEWIYQLQQLAGVQAEICIQIKAIEYRESLKKLDGKKREIDSQIEHIADADEMVPDEIQESKEIAEAMEKELKSARYPIMNTCISICVAADTLEGLEKKVMLVKGFYEDRNFVIERPITDQITLYLQHIPSVGCMIKDFLMPLTPMNVASGAIGASHELGDKKGQYIGTTGTEKKNVFLWMALACLLNKSASATFFGNLGVGKSFNANLLLYLNVLYGGYGLVFDPKGERSEWIHRLKQLDGLITIVSLSSAPEYEGMLDPYVVYRGEIHLANELALNILSELFKINPTSDEYMALLVATKEISERSRKEEYCPSMTELARILDNFDPEDELLDKAKKMARRIRLQRQAGMSRLLIGDGSQEAIALDNRLNILQIQNLKLPSPEAKKEDYTNEESLSTVIMMVLSQFAKKFAMAKLSGFKIILFDESWALGKTTEGVKLYDFLSRMGRSLYSGCIFNGHSVLDIPTEGIKNTITYKFCFQTTNDAEAKRMCDYLGLESTKENKDIIKELKNRECLFQDLNGRVGILEFDAVFDELIEAFSTTPTQDKKDPEERTPVFDDLEEMDTESEEQSKFKEKAAENKKTQEKRVEDPEVINIYEMEEEWKKPTLDSNEIYKQEDYKLGDKTSLPLYQNPEAMFTQKLVANKVLVGFMGSETGIGVTHNMMLCAGYLSNMGHHVACIEPLSNPVPSFQHIKEMAGIVEDKQEVFTVNGVDYYPKFDLEDLPILLSGGYHFLLLDFGAFRQELVKEFGRCVIQIVVCGSKPWQLSNVMHLFDQYPEEILKQFYYVFNLTEKDRYPVLKKNMGVLNRVLIADTIADPMNTEKIRYPEKIFGDYVKSQTAEENEVEKKGLLGGLFERIF